MNTRMKSSIKRYASVSLILFSIALTCAWAIAQGLRLYPDEQFSGKLAKSIRDSIPAWPQIPTARPGSPNVVIFLLDDVGFANLGSYGGPINTPNIDRLARAGLRYNSYTTNAICSATRASLLTGRNCHSVGVGNVTEAEAGYPGYNMRIPKSAATLAEILKENGYNTFAVGKWHLTRPEDTSAAGPFDNWPTSMGFEHWFGFHHGETSQWNPELYEDTHPVEMRRPGQPPNGQTGSALEQWRKGQSYHLTTALADRAIQLIRQQKSIAPQRPFFLYFATAAAHAPHQAPKQFIDRYRGKFDKGWDEMRKEVLARQKEMGIVPPDTQLAPRSPGAPPWSSLTADQKRVYAHMMEIFAGYLEHADYEFGRILAALQAMGQMDNTLIIVTSDNGGSAEGTPGGLFNEASTFNGTPDDFKWIMANMQELGSPMAYNHYPVGWSEVSNTPFKYYKQTVHFGGTRDPLIVYYPKVIKQGGAVRGQFCHVIDIAPTILDVLHITPPAIVNGVRQKPLEGASFAATFTNPDAPPARDTQYYEMMGNRAIWHDGWKAVTFHGRLPWALTSVSPHSFDRDKWELYHVTDDFSETHDLAQENPGKLKELIALWWQEAWKYNVLPLNDVTTLRREPKPSFSLGRTQFTYFPGTVRVPESLAPDVKNRSYSITAEVQIPEGGAEGMLVTEGGRFGGYGFFIRDRRLVFVYNFLDRTRYTVTSSEPVPPGADVLRFEFTKTGGNQGIGTLFVNGTKAGEGRIEHTIPYVFSDHDTFDVGEDTGTPVSEDYHCPFRFSGTINKVVFALKDDKGGPAAVRSEAEQRRKAQLAAQ